MRPHIIVALIQRQNLSAFWLALSAVFLVMCGSGIMSRTAQSAQQGEREFEDKTPRHLPIKITIKNPEKAKDIKNEDWLRDLEIEVENRSDKPIYYLRLLVILDDVATEDGNHIGFPLRYGRTDLIEWSAPLQPDDVPLKPGETYIFRIPEDPRLGWESYAARYGIAKSAPKKVRITFQSLNFGDGTGFGTSEGVPVGSHDKAKTNS